MKAKLLLAWRILVAAGMAAILFIAGVIIYKLCEDYYRTHEEETYTQTISYSEDYVIEYNKEGIRTKEVATGKYLTPAFDKLFEVRIPDSLTVFIQNDKRGYLNVYTGKITIPAQYDRAWIFSEGLGAVVKDGQLGFIGHGGEMVIPFRPGYRTLQKERVDFVFKNGYCTVYDTSGKHGLIDKTGAWMIEPQYDHIYNPEKGFRLVENNGKYGLLDAELLMALAPEYDQVVILDEGIIVRKDHEQKLLAFDLKTVLQPFVYNFLNPLSYNSGQTDNEGDEIYLLSEYRSFFIGGKCGLMDKNGKVTVPAIYEHISAVGNNLFSCAITEFGHYITINGKGEVIQ